MKDYSKKKKKGVLNQFCLLKDLDDLYRIN